MPRRTYKEFSRAWDALIAKYGITEVPEREYPSTTTFDVILRQRRAESLASSDETPDGDMPNLR